MCPARGCGTCAGCPRSKPNAARWRSSARSTMANCATCRPVAARGSARSCVDMAAAKIDFSRSRAPGREMAANLKQPAARNRVAIGALMVLLLAFGSRHLLTRPIPAIGELQPLTGSARQLLRDWWSGWHDVGGGVDTPAPTGQGLLGLVSLLSFGHLAFVRKALAFAAPRRGPGWCVACRPHVRFATGLVRRRVVSTPPRPSRTTRSLPDR